MGLYEHALAPTKNNQFSNKKHQHYNTIASKHVIQLPLFFSLHFTISVAFVHLFSWIVYVPMSPRIHWAIPTLSTVRREGRGAEVAWRSLPEASRNRSIWKIETPEVYPPGSLGTTVDGSEIRLYNQLRLVVYSHLLQGFIHPRWLFGISSINISTYPFPYLWVDDFPNFPIDGICFLVALERPQKESLF